jgi:hypothetical protein
MGTRVYLYNSTRQGPSHSFWADGPDAAPEPPQEGQKATEIADINNTGIPIPWMLYFGLEDFQTMSVQTEEGTNYKIPMPCTTVPLALQRTLKTLPVFERLAGDAQIAKEYWQEAVDLLEKLPFPYLSMDHSEWLDAGGEEIDVVFPAFKDAYANGIPPDAFLMEYSCFRKGERPYSHEEWDKHVTKYDWQNKRQMNAIAMGYSHSMFETLHVNERVGNDWKRYDMPCGAAVNRVSRR